MIIWAFILDLIVGDPKWFPHPVVIIGRAVNTLERVLRKWFAPAFGLKLAGVILPLLIISFVYLITWQIIQLVSGFNDMLGWLLAIWLMSTTIATKGLYQVAREIYELLKVGDFAEARKKVGWIVGRDTGNLEKTEIVRATVETVAENIVDGIISPLCYGLIGGVQLAMAYRAVNTLDSMVGYKNERYHDFGWASARLDDLANYIPARITAGLIILTAIIIGGDWQAGWKAMLRDAAKHPSPNSGYPESTTAGVLGIRLGGLNYYSGQPSMRAYMGDELRKLEIEDIRRTWQLMFGTAISAIIVGFLFWQGYTYIPSQIISLLKQ